MRRAILLVGVSLVSCKAKGGADMAEYDQRAPAPGMAGSAMARSMSVDKADEKEEQKGEAGGKTSTKPAETWKRSQLVPNSSRVMVGDREQLALRSMQTKVAIDGFRARVVIDYVYANELDRQLEGTFQLRLPEEASPYFFAFGETAYASDAPSPKLVIAADDPEPAQIMKQRETAWQQPKVARMVPRETAAMAYGQTVRRRVDPALVEWAGAGVFTARVFPLAPHRLHRIVVGYDVDLTAIGSDFEYRLDLPEQVPASSVDVSVAGQATASPETRPTAINGRSLFHFENRKDRQIAIRIAKANAPVIVGTDPKTGTYFAARVAPQLPAAAAASSDSAVFLVDTSLSSNPDRFNIYLKLLRAVLDENRDSLKKFDVLFFSVDAHWYRPGFVDNTPANVDELLAFANGLALEGATDLGGALAEAARPAWAATGTAKPDLFLLSDGASTWGESDLHALGKILDGAGALFAYSTGLAGTDTGTLVHLARDSGGAVFSVTGEAEVAKAAKAHRARPWRLTGVAVTGGSDVLLAGNPTSVFPGQTLLVAGRGQLGAGAELALTVEQGDRKAIVKTKLGAPLASALAPRAYGQIATAHLEELEAATEPQSRAYATHFRVTGRTCSLLMLESEADYERFNIKPDDDAYVVKATPAGELFAKVLKQTIDTLGDPKAAFLAMIEKLEKSPYVKLQVPASYRTAIEHMPASAFAVPSAPLQTKLRGRSQLGSELAARLAKHDLDYDTITNAAAARHDPYGAADVLKALSSLVEENPGDAVLARDVGFSAMDLGLRPQAYHLFRRVAEARPYEPQTYRAMAQALAAMGKTDLALAYYEIPLMGTWDARFGELQAIVELDELRFLRHIQANQTSTYDYAKSRMAALAQKVGIDKADVVVTITWNTDNTDVDLHVTEPSGEECFYSHPNTASGGRLTRDVTQGYGPEMYVLRRAPKGKYEVRAHYFASDTNRASARTKVHVTVIENWGTAAERANEQVVTLETGKEYHAIATLQR